MIAASRFEGGTWVRVGFLVTYAAFAYGCVVVWMSVARARHDREPVSVWGVLSTGFAVAAVVLLGLPAIEFPDETLNGFRGLDVLSLLSAVALAAAVVAGAMRFEAALCLSGVLVGNLLIQHFTTRGSVDRYGLALATTAALAAAVCALPGVRGRREVPQ